MSWTVKSVMTEDCVSVLPATTFKECVDMISLHRIGALPVVDVSGRLLGILTESDLLRKEERTMGGEDRRAAARTAAEAMTHALVTSTPESTVVEAARLMHASSIRHLPIIDTAGRLVGIVSRADLLKVFLRSDESIRREIDEVLLPGTFGIPRGTLELDVREGVVRIEGEVDSSGLARLVVAFIRRVEGVVAVDGLPTHRRDDDRPRSTAPPVEGAVAGPVPATGLPGRPRLIAQI